ncbi:MAG: BtpA/SgcQ family protein [Blautia sp.]|jgi:membrane complex biogenesis BtpA family protein
MKTWMEELFGTKKPIIGLLHLKALPGDPFYEEAGGMKAVIEQAEADLMALQNGGVDGVLMTNEFSLPYEKKVAPVTLAAMGRVAGILEQKRTVPFGAEAIYDDGATIELCAAVGADFTRCVFTGAYAGDLGLVDRDIAKTLRRRRALGMSGLKMFYFVNSEGEVYLNDRDEMEVTKTMLFNCRPDALVVAGAMAGSNPENSLITKIKEASGDTPVVCGTGCKEENIGQLLPLCDGAFVGTAFKAGGNFASPIDEQRVRSFMDKVRELRD